MARKAPWTLAMLFLVFGAPVALAWLYVLKPALLPAAHANYGQLIDPPVATPLKGAWTLLIPHADKCDRQCRHAHRVAAVVKRALGPEAYRRVNGPIACADQAEKKPPPEVSTACSLAMSAAGVGASVVIIDPMGNAMMRYGSTVAPRDLLKDMQVLLAASADWRIDERR